MPTSIAIFEKSTRKKMSQKYWELKENSPVADGNISTFVIITRTCDFFPSSSKEVELNIICLPLTSSVSSFLENFCEPENPNNDNIWFSSEAVNYGSILIIQLLYYVNFQEKLIKDNHKVKCPSKCLSLPVNVDDVSILRTFKLWASTSLGTINAGHYWEFIRDTGNSSWLKCDDNSVTSVFQARE